MAIQGIKAILIITFLLCCSLVQAAFDLSTQLEPEGRLKLRLDFPWARQSSSPDAKDHTWVVSSHLTFKNPVSEISDGQLIRLALDAYDEIRPEITRYVTGNSRRSAVPRAMNALAFGNEVILVSSFKGGQDFVSHFPDSEVSKLLEQCTATFQRTQREVDELDEHQGGAGNSHRTGGHCGEITGFHLYSRRYPNEPLRLRSDNPRSTTVNPRGGTVQPADPCELEVSHFDSATITTNNLLTLYQEGEAEQGFMHGCGWIVRQQGVDYLSSGGGEPYQLDGENALAGGLDGPIGQLLMCS